MADRPTVASSTEEMYSALGPWATADTSGEEWPLLEMTESVAARLQPVEDVIRDDEVGPGWSSVVDVERAPSSWLPWLAQFGGARIPQGMTEADQRAYIQSAPNQKRGTVAAFTAAATRSLTGTRTSIVTERYGTAWRVAVFTLESETPDAAQLTEDLLSQKPAGIVLTVSQSDGNDYKSLRDTHRDYGHVVDVFTDYSDVVSDPTQQ